MLVELCKARLLRTFNDRLGLEKNIGKFRFMIAQGSSLLDIILRRSKGFIDGMI